MIESDAPGPVVTPVTYDRVREVIEAHVLPYMRNHGGGLHITDVADDGTVTCKLDGACRGCPAAAVTVVAVIERALRTHISTRIKVQAPQIAVSSAAMERIRRFYPERVDGLGTAPQLRHHDQAAARRTERYHRGRAGPTRLDRRPR